MDASEQVKTACPALDVPRRRFMIVALSRVSSDVGREEVLATSLLSRARDHAGSPLWHGYRHVERRQGCLYLCIPGTALLLVCKTWVLWIVESISGNCKPRHRWSQSLTIIASHFLHQAPPSLSCQQGRFSSLEKPTIRWPMTQFLRLTFGLFMLNYWEIPPSEMGKMISVVGKFPERMWKVGEFARTILEADFRLLTYQTHPNAMFLATSTRVLCRKHFNENGDFMSQAPVWSCLPSFTNSFWAGCLTGSRLDHWLARCGSVVPWRNFESRCNVV